MTNPLGNLQEPSTMMGSDIATGVKNHNASSSMGSGDAKGNLESLKALDSVSKGDFPPKVEVSEVDDSNHFGDTRNVVGAVLGGGAAAGSYTLNNKIIDYSKRSLTDTQKKEIGSFAAEGVPGDKTSRFQNFKTANLEKAQAIENFGNVVDPEDGRVKKGSRRVAKFLSDHASEADRKVQAHHDATRALKHADDAVEAGSKAAKHMPKSRTLRIAKSLGSWSKRNAGKLAAGAAKRGGSRIALGAAFPVGTVVSIATLAMDPMIINLVRGGIDRAFGHNPPSVDAEPLPPLTHILPVWHADGKEAEEKVAQMSADEAYEHDKSNRAIIVADKFLSDVIDNQFAFDKTQVWPPEDPNPTETSHFDNYHNSFDPIIQAVIDAVDATLNPLQKYSEEEPTVSKLLEAREDFITSISSMPEHYLLDIAEKSKNNTVAFENTYNTFRNSNVHCRELVHTAHNTGETMWGMVGNPLRMVAPRVLQTEDLMTIERDFKEQEQNLTKAHQELKNAGKNWSYTDNGTSPIFHPQHLQNKLVQADEKLKDKDKEDLTKSHDTNRTSPSLPQPGRIGGGTTHTSGFSSPSRGGGSGMSRPSLPNFKDDVNVDDILDGINTKSKTTPASGLSTPDKPEGFGADLPDPTDTFKKSDGLNPDLPDAKTDPVSIKGPNLPDPKKEDHKTPEFKAPDVDTSTTGPKKDTSLPDPTKTTTSSSHTLSTPPSVNTDTKKPDFTPPSSINTNTKKPDFHAPSSINTGPVATPSAPKTPTPPRPTSPSGGGLPSGGAPHGEKPKTQSVPNPAHPAKDTPGNPFNKKDAPTPPDPDKEAQDNKKDHPGEAPEFDKADNNGERENTTISRDGKEFDLKSSKAAKLAELINPTTNEDPKGIREALGEAGYNVPDPGSNVGERISAMDIQPGDLVIGNELEGIYVGDGQVLTSEGLKPLAEVADFVNEGQGIFRPEDADVDAKSGHTGQDATATEDFEKDPEKESKTAAHDTKQGSAPTGIGGVGNGRHAAASSGLGSKGGNKASVTPKGDPFDPGNSSSTSSDPFERISVTGTGGIGRSFGANVPTGD